MAGDVARAQYLGTYRHYYGHEDVYVYITDSASSFEPKTGLGLDTGSGGIRINLRFPDGTNHDKHGSGAPANTFSEPSAINTPGWYRIRLWGSDQDGTAWDEDLKQVGTVHGVLWNSTAATSEELSFCYDVRDDWDIDLALVYSEGTGGTDQVKGTLVFHHWHSHERLDNSSNPFDTGTDPQIVIRDPAGNALDTVNWTDYTRNNGKYYFTSTIGGVSGSNILTAEVSATWNGEAVAKEFLFPVRFPA